MSSETPTPVGTIGWFDLTVGDANVVREFYVRVVGWQWDAVHMKDYDDFAMIPPGGTDPVAGICHARGTNADLPPQWLMYIVVEDVDRSVETCITEGGSVVVPARDMGGGRFSVIRDPAGAVCALYSQAE